MVGYAGREFTMGLLRRRVRRRRTGTVVILGCGPSGLLAANAAEMMGFTFHILSKKRPSQLFGCQYLHAPIPGVADYQPEMVRYRLEGSPEVYREKVYGLDSLDVQTSVEEYGPNSDHRAWDIRRAYRTLWDKYESVIEDEPNISYRLVEPILAHYGAHAIISTIPAPALCVKLNEHTFRYADVWAMGDAPEHGQEVPVPVDPFTVICNGSTDQSWYRAANVFGYKTVEWPWRGGKRPPINGVVSVEKPISTTCDCWKGEVYGVGRYGAWQKGLLAHDAYLSTIKILDGLG